MPPPFPVGGFSHGGWPPTRVTLFASDAGDVVASDAWDVVASDAGDVVASDAGDVVSSDAGDVVASDADEVPTAAAKAAAAARKAAGPPLPPSLPGGGVFACGLASDAGDLVASDAGDLAPPLQKSHAPPRRRPLFPISSMDSDSAHAAGQMVNGSILGSGPQVFPHRGNLSVALKRISRRIKKTSRPSMGGE